MSALQTILLTLALLSFSASLASAAPKMVRQFDHWGLFSYKSGGRTVCYVLSVPVKEDPVGVDHGRNFFLIAPKSGASGAYYPQAVMGYSVKPGTTIDLAVDGKAFAMLPKDNVGWTRQEADDSRVIAAMQRGSDLSIKATSRRGTETRYTYSLKGVSAALKQAAACR
ncbi:invasion associated locus B family protein [Allorhizobium undicola]|uniref:invasion associated locus B family protein n=1 Tax=Allorhizobium undicola TaxID=78527 RepID=UPI00048710E9|nr:invasion associated locus B family protein [Allorhizobium undicola]